VLISSPCDSGYTVISAPTDRALEIASCYLSEALLTNENTRGNDKIVWADERRGNGHKLKQRKFRLNTRKNFFPLRVTEPWSRLPREAVESPSLEIFQTRLATVLCSLLWVTLLRQGVGLGDPQRSLPTPNIL